MNVFDKISNNIKKFNLNNELDKIILSNEDAIIRLNLEQLSIGQLSNGSEISPLLRNADYARGKKSKGGKAPEGVPDLNNTGSFYEGFNIGVNRKVIKVNSKDSKTRDLTKKYGVDIFGLQQENLSVYAHNIVKPLLISSIKELFKV